MNISELSIPSSIDKSEDPDVAAKKNEIQEILIAAGYFRAKINGISIFDKIVGGMAWCLECCDCGVDVDLLFHETLSIGQKIALVEKIVSVLIEMQCPFPIEPHQIQCLEFIRIHSVIQWLVKRSTDNLKERAERLKNFAIGQFHNSYQFKIDKDNLAKLRAASGGIKHIQNINVNALQKADVTNRMNLRKHYSELLSEMKVDVKKLSDNNQLATFKSRAAIIEQKLLRRKEEINDTECQIKTLQGQSNSAQNKLDNRKNQINLFSDMEANVDKELLKQVQAILAQHDDVKRTEAEYKKDCRNEIDRIQLKVEELQLFHTRDEGEQTQFVNKLKQECDDLKFQLAKKNRNIVIIQRQMDDIPDRGELSQYQRRFHELHDEVCAKHIETKQYYTLFNTLNDKKMYLERELSLLNSICDAYNVGMISAHGREDFITQFENIMESVRKAEVKIKQKYSDELIRRDALSKKLLSLYDLQRQYSSKIGELSAKFKLCQTLQHVS